jgi:hypothetical protein
MPDARISRAIRFVPTARPRHVALHAHEARHTCRARWHGSYALASAAHHRHEACRWRTRTPGKKPAADTPSTRAMVVIGKQAWFALMNWKTRTGSLRSPLRTRPLPLPRYRAPGATAGSRCADGSAPRAPCSSPRPGAGLHRDRLGEPSSGSTARSARIHATALPAFTQNGQARPSVAGTPAHRPGDSSASATPPSQMERCPPNRINSNPPLRSARDRTSVGNPRMNCVADDHSSTTAGRSEAAPDEQTEMR